MKKNENHKENVLPIYGLCWVTVGRSDMLRTKPHSGGEGTELLENSQDVWIQVRGKKQILERHHVLLDGVLVLDCGERYGVSVMATGNEHGLTPDWHSTCRKVCCNLWMQLLYHGDWMSVPVVSHRTKCSVRIMMKRCRLDSGKAKVRNNFLNYDKSKKLPYKVTLHNAISIKKGK